MPAAIASVCCRHRGRSAPWRVCTCCANGCGKRMGGWPYGRRPGQSLFAAAAARGLYQSSTSSAPRGPRLAARARGAVRLTPCCCCVTNGPSTTSGRGSQRGGRGRPRFPVRANVVTPGQAAIRAAREPVKPSRQNAGMLATRACVPATTSLSETRAPSCPPSLAAHPRCLAGLRLPHPSPAPACVRERCTSHRGAPGWPAGCAAGVG
jgi:hypothetical protein